MIGIGLLDRASSASATPTRFSDVRNAELVANYSRSPKRCARRSPRRGTRRHGLRRPWTRSAPTRRSTLVVVALPNEVHLEAVEHRGEARARRSSAPSRWRAPAPRPRRSSTRATTPACGTATPRARCSRRISPRPIEMVQAGGIGELLTMRAREGHSGPHAAALLGCRDRRRRRTARHGLPHGRIGAPLLRQGQPGHRGLRLGRDAWRTGTRPPARMPRSRCSSSPAASWRRSSRRGSSRAACSCATSSSAPPAGSSPTPRSARSGASSRTRWATSSRRPTGNRLGLSRARRDAESF